MPDCFSTLLQKSFRTKHDDELAHDSDEVLEGHPPVPAPVSAHNGRQHHAAYREPWNDGASIETVPSGIK